MAIVNIKKSQLRKTLKNAYEKLKSPINYSKYLFSDHEELYYKEDEIDFQITTLHEDKEVVWAYRDPKDNSWYVIETWTIQKFIMKFGVK